MPTHSPAPLRALRPALLRVLLCVLLPVLLLMAAVLLPLPAATAATQEESPVAFVIAASGGGVITPGQGFAISAQAPGDATAPGDVLFRYAPHRLESADEIAAWLGGDLGIDDTVPLATAAFTPTASGGLTATATVDATAGGVDQLAPGVYPLLATASGDTARSTIVVPAATSAPVAAIVPLVAPAIDHPLLTADELEQLTGPDGSLRAQLDAVAGTAAVLAVDPAIVAAIRVLGDEAPSGATAWLDRLLALPNERFALTFGDTDLTAQLAAGLEQPLQIETLAPLLANGGFSEPDAGEGDAAPQQPADTPAPPPSSPQPTPGDQPHTVAELLDIGPALPPVWWPATGTASGDAVTSLMGFAPEHTITLATSDVADAAPWVRAGDAYALTYDARLAGALREIALRDPGVQRAAAHATASAYAAVADPSQPLLAVVDRPASTASDPHTGLRDAVLTATGLAGRPSTDLSSITASAATATTFAETGTVADEGRANILSALLADEDRLARFGTILADPAVLTAPERARTLQLMGNAWLGDADGWADAVAERRATTQSTLGSVHLVPSSDMVLLGTNTSLVFTVRNDLRWPVSLVAYAQPSDPRLVVQERTTIEAGAAQNTRIEIPVQSRVASGETRLEVSLRGLEPHSIPVGDPVTIRVSVRAEWESVGVVVLAIGVAVLLVAGTVRTVQRIRKRRASRAEAESGAAEAGNADAGDTAAGTEQTVGGTKDVDG
ncbi:DUF6049 family protein [Microbacterium sp. No. 7]|uniref:DUF6049 family protein n=1 Tax=Microbacterium sp. No. 7 TaxID=1714373 RepID=UPI0006CFD2E6|nr:DUF6049 family protein [Microbacterium sp. No. 7]